MTSVLLGLVLSATPVQTPRATVHMHKGTEGAILLGCLRDRDEMHCFELADFLDELDLQAVEKKKAAPKKEAAPDAGTVEL